MKRLLFFLFLFFILFPALGLASTVYYVNPQAPGGGNGTYSRPWNSIDQINSHRFSTGDKVYFKVGTTTTLRAGQRLNITWDGAPNNPAVIGAYYGNGQFGLGGNPRPIISGLSGGTRTGGVLHAGAIHYMKSNAVGYVHVKDLHITGVIGLGVMLHGRHGIAGNGRSIEYCRVENVETSNIGGQGIGLFLTFHSIVENCITMNTNQCRDHYRAGAGIEISAMNAEGCANYNIARGNIVSRGFEGIGNYKGARYTLIENNIVYDCQTYYIYVSRSRTATIRNNIVYSTPAGRGRGAGIAFDCEVDVAGYEPIPIGENTVHNNYLGGLGTGILIVNNARGHGVYHNNNNIYNNRIVDCGMNFRIAHDDHLWRDNHIYNNFSFIFGNSTHVAGTSPRGVTWTNNFFNSAVGGNAGATAIFSGYQLAKTTGWRNLPPGGVDKSFFRFTNEIETSLAPPIIIDISPN